MKHLWANEELIGNFTLSPAELTLLANKTNVSKLCLAIFLKLFQYEGRFPTRRAEVPRAIVKFIADQIDVPIGFFEKYKWKGWMIETHRAQIRKL